jgi:hypothetical protein
LNIVRESVVVQVYVWKRVYAWKRGEIFGCPDIELQ